MLPASRSYFRRAGYIGCWLKGSRKAPKERGRNMPTNVIMPQMGESIAEGTVTKWLKKVGDKVERDEPLFEISTDKVDAEIPAPASGVLKEIKVKEGTTVQVNTVVAVIGGAGAPAAAPAKPAAPPAPAKPAMQQPAVQPQAPPPQLEVVPSHAGDG